VDPPSLSGLPDDLIELILGLLGPLDLLALRCCSPALGAAAVAGLRAKRRLVAVGGKEERGSARLDVFVLDWATLLWDGEALPPLSSKPNDDLRGGNDRWGLISEPVSPKWAGLWRRPLVQAE
jgi:hypothetical protein